MVWMADVGMRWGWMLETLMCVIASTYKKSCGLTGNSGIWAAFLDSNNIKVAKPPQTYHHYFKK